MSPAIGRTSNMTYRRAEAKAAFISASFFSANARDKAGNEAIAKGTPIRFIGNDWRSFAKANTVMLPLESREASEVITIALSWYSIATGMRGGARGNTFA